MRDLLEWLEKFTDNPEDTEVLAPAHINQGSDSERSTIAFILISQKIKISKYACEPRKQGLFAEDALAKLYFEQKSFVT